MNFTREPILETVITPREGCKLVIRNSKGNGQEDYFVDAVEVVSFGHSFFFRSSERPKAFLVPVGDYEVLELKETRMVLKNASTERSIKIGGGRDAPPRPPRDFQENRQESRHDGRQEGRPDEGESSPAAERSPEMRSNDRLPDRKRDNKRRRGRRDRGRGDRPLPSPQHEPFPPAEDRSSFPEERPSLEESALPEGMAPTPAAPPSEEKKPSFISKLFPPPSTLIKETLSRYKPVEVVEEKSVFDETIFRDPIPTKKEQEESDSEDLPGV